MPASSRTRLNDEDLAQIRGAIVNYLQKHEFITNRLLRGLADIGYDQCIFAFGELLRSGDLVKVGTASATRYVLAKKKRKR
jgi:hypothetical protein